MTPAAERGSISLELAVLAPALLLLLGFVVAAGRMQVAGSAVEHAARVAAREASLARTPQGASAAAAQVARDTLGGQGPPCTGVRVSVDTTGFTVPVGRPAQVRATVTCTVALADLGVPGLPGRRTLTGQSVSPLDRYRAR